MTNQVSMYPPFNKLNKEGSELKRCKSAEKVRIKTNILDF